MEGVIRDCVACCIADISLEVTGLDEWEGVGNGVWFLHQRAV